MNAIVPRDWHRAHFELDSRIISYAAHFEGGLFIRDESLIGLLASILNYYLFIEENERGFEFYCASFFFFNVRVWKGCRVQQR